MNKRRRPGTCTYDRNTQNKELGYSEIPIHADLKGSCISCDSVASGQDGLDSTLGAPSSWLLTKEALRLSPVKAGEAGSRATGI